jgi:signal transduction histidine kinase
VAGEIALPFVSTSGDGARVEEARLVVTQSMAPLIQLRRSVDRWSLIAGLLAIAAALLLGTWAAARLTRPLADLAEQTDRLDLARLDVEFARQRTDEVGALARVLAALTERLRRGAQQLREAERRATVGDLARQVNHDIKNGLAPIRNVLRHLAEVAEQRPEQLPAVFRERKGTLDSGVQYLETLAASYARLSPKLDRGSTDVRGVVEEVVRGAARDGVDITTEIAPRLPPVRGDAVVVRRIVENVVSNAVDAVGSAAPAPGEVRIAAGSAEAALRVRIAVTDTGPGMSREQLDRAFEDFYTTKPGGTGLGLSVVRRLVADLEGSLKVETEPGSGTTVEITLPAAEPPELPSAPPSNRPTAI